MTTDTSSQILKRLSELEKEEGSLPLLLQFYRDLLLVQNAARKRLGTPQAVLTDEAARKRIQQELPLLDFGKLKLDWEPVQEVFARVITVFAGYPQLFGEVPEKLKRPGAGRLLTRKAAKAWFAGQELPATLRGDVSDSLMQAMIQTTFQPFLLSHARALLGHLDRGQWYQRYCPVCGGSSDFAFLDKESGARWLVCSRCDTEWRFPRLECACCGNKDQSTLAYFADGDGRYRLYVCERCRGYLKAIDLRQATSDVLLPLERLLTSDMDRQAREKGYGLPAPTTTES